MRLHEVVKSMPSLAGKKLWILVIVIKRNHYCCYLALSPLIPKARNRKTPCPNKPEQAIKQASGPAQPNIPDKEKTSAQRNREPRKVKEAARSLDLKET